MRSHIATTAFQRPLLANEEQILAIFRVIGMKLEHQALYHLTGMIA